MKAGCTCRRRKSEPPRVTPGLPMGTGVPAYGDEPATVVLGRAAGAVRGLSPDFRKKPDVNSRFP